MSFPILIFVFYNLGAAKLLRIRSIGCLSSLVRRMLVIFQIDSPGFESQQRHKNFLNQQIARYTNCYM